MEFSLHIQTRITDWQIIKELELLGYDSVWVPDTSDDVERLLFHHGASRPKYRPNKNRNRSSHRWNPDCPNYSSGYLICKCVSARKKFLGIGTGHTAMRVMGQDPLPIAEFREYLRVVRSMLATKKRNIPTEIRQHPLFGRTMAKVFATLRSKSQFT